MYLVCAIVCVRVHLEPYIMLLKMCFTPILFPHVAQREEDEEGEEETIVFWLPFLMIIHEDFRLRELLF